VILCDWPEAPDRFAAGGGQPIGGP
jgi:hypothetical protein